MLVSLFARRLWRPVDAPDSHRDQPGASSISGSAGVTVNLWKVSGDKSARELAKRNRKAGSDEQEV
jgi:hypothetical protein